MGELSSARQALQGPSLAPGTEATLNPLRNPEKRPRVPREPLPRELVSHVPAFQFNLDADQFARNVRSARRGAAGGPSGMTVEHLQPLLTVPRDVRAFHHVAERLSRGQVPSSIRDAIRLRRLTALRKPNGGVRGIVAGHIVRRLVARTISQQLAEEVQTATAPFQYALSTRSGCECVAHALQGLTEIDPRATVSSIDGISAYDLISRQAMLEGLREMPGGASILPFVSMFYGGPSSYLWEDALGRVHTIVQGEGGEQGDALMPLLFSLEQHNALLRVQERLRTGESLMAFLDDIYVVTVPERVVEVHRTLEESLWADAGIRVHQGKTQTWNRAGEKPPRCEVPEQRARDMDPTSVVWRGCDDLPACQRGIKVLGTPLEQVEFIWAHFDQKTAEHQVLLDRIPLLKTRRRCGCCWSTVQQPEQTISRESLSQEPQKIFAEPMTSCCGGVSVPSCRSPRCNQQK